MTDIAKGIGIAMCAKVVYFFEMRGPSGLSSTPTREKSKCKRRTRK
jgi:hypothetical protein